MPGIRAGRWSAELTNGLRDPTAPAGDLVVATPELQFRPVDHDRVTLDAIGESITARADDGAIGAARGPTIRRTGTSGHGTISRQRREGTHLPLLTQRIARLALS